MSSAFHTSPFGAAYGNWSHVCSRRCRLSRSVIRLSWLRCWLFSHPVTLWFISCSPYQESAAAINWPLYRNEVHYGCLDRALWLSTVSSVYKPQSYQFISSIRDFWGFVLKYSYHYPLHLLCVKLSRRSVSAFLFFLSGYHRGR